MLQCDQLIDDIGQIWDANSYQLRLSQNGLTAGSAFPQYAICNLGFVGVVKHGRAIEVILRPETITDHAFAQMIYMLADSGDKKLVITKWMRGSFQHQIVASAFSGIELLTKMLGSRKEEASRRHIRRSLSEDEIESTPRFSKCVSSLQTLGDRTPIDRAQEIVSKQFNDRFVLFEQDPHDGFVLRRYGDNNPKHALDWYENSLDQPLENHIDLEYLWFCNNAYRQALTQMRPLCEYVDAYVAPPGCQDLHRTYSRFVLPLLHDTRRFVLVATIEDPNICLRAS